MFSQTIFYSVSPLNTTVHRSHASLPVSVRSLLERKYRESNRKIPSKNTNKQDQQMAEFDNKLSAVRFPEKINNEKQRL